MPDRFDKFSERARRVLSLAQEEALRFGHNYIGTEHLLLGLLREEEGVAAKVLNSLGVRLDTARARLESVVGRGDRAVLGEIGLTPRAKRVIELAVDEARRMNHRYIETEHILLGLLREGHGIAAGLLESLGVQLDRARGETLRFLREGAQPAPSPTEARRAYSPNVIDSREPLRSMLATRRAFQAELDYAQQADDHEYAKHLQAMLERMDADIERTRALLTPGAEQREPLRSLRRALSELSREKTAAIEAGQYEHAAAVREIEIALAAQAEKLAKLLNPDEHT